MEEKIGLYYCGKCDVMVFGFKCFGILKVF